MKLSRKRREDVREVGNEKKHDQIKIYEKILRKNKF